MLRFGLRFAFLFGLVAILVLTTDAERVVASFGSHIWIGVLAAQVPLLIALLVAARRHAILVANPPARLSAAFGAMLLSAGFNQLLPGRAAELLKATYLRRQIGIRMSAGVGAIVLERFTDLIVVGFIGVIASALVLLDVNWHLAGLILVMGTAGLLSMTKAMPLLQRMAGWIPWPMLARFVKQLLIHVAERIEQRQFPPALLLGTVMWAFSLVGLWAYCLYACSPTLEVGQVLALFVAIQFGAAIPVLPGGVGTLEAAAVMVLMQYGMTFDESVAVAIGLRLINIVVLVPVALLIAATGRTGLNDLITQVRSLLRDGRTRGD